MYKGGIKFMKGFTLVELLAVIIVLGAISLVVIPSVQRSVNRSGEQAYEVQVSNIEDAAKNWAADHIDSLPDHGKTVTITLEDLMQGNYVEQDLENPKTKKPFAKDTKIIIKNINENYTYKFVES